MSELYDGVQMNKYISSRNTILCCHYQDINEYHHNYVMEWFLLTQQSMGRNKFGKNRSLKDFRSIEALNYHFEAYFGGLFVHTISETTIPLQIFLN